MSEGLVEDSTGLHDQERNGVFPGPLGVGFETPKGYGTIFVWSLSVEVDRRQQDSCGFD